MNPVVCYLRNVQLAPTEFVFIDNNSENPAKLESFLLSLYASGRLNGNFRYLKHPERQFSRVPTLNPAVIVVVYVSVRPYYCILLSKTPSFMPISTPKKPGKPLRVTVLPRLERLQFDLERTTAGPFTVRLWAFLYKLDTLLFKLQRTIFENNAYRVVEGNLPPSQARKLVSGGSLQLTNRHLLKWVSIFRRRGIMVVNY